jgi:hypothetical protein
MADPELGLRTWIQKLGDADPAVRETSIKELELLGSTRALSALADIFATDTDPAIRGLAQWAGKSIYYRAIQRVLERKGPSDEERRRAAEILAQAESRKQQNKRKT